MVMGDLRIIKNNKLKNFFTKRTKYREPRKTDLTEQSKTLLTD